MSRDTKKPINEDSFRLTPDQLRWRCDPASFPFESTSDLGECPISIIGQPRAMDALKLGFDIRSDGYNIFVAGEVGTGRSTAVKQILTEMDAGECAPEDLVYVHNFKDPDCPRLLAFPAGQGRAFRKAMEEAIERLPKSLWIVDGHGPSILHRQPTQRQQLLVGDAQSQLHHLTGKGPPLAQYSFIDHVTQAALVPPPGNRHHSQQERRDDEQGRHLKDQGYGYENECQMNPRLVEHDDR